MEICGPVLERDRLGHRVATARLEVLFTFTYRKISSGTIVGAYPVGFGDRRQHCVFGWVEGFVPCFGTVSGPGHEHDGGGAFAAALQIHLAVPADIDQAGKILVVAGAAFGGVVVGAPAGGGRRGSSGQHHDEGEAHGQPPASGSPEARG